MAGFEPASGETSVTLCACFGKFFAKFPADGCCNRTSLREKEEASESITCWDFLPNSGGRELGLIRPAAAGATRSLRLWATGGAFSKSSSSSSNSFLPLMSGAVSSARFSGAALATNSLFSGTLNGCSLSGTLLGGGGSLNTLLSSGRLL